MKQLATVQYKGLIDIREFIKNKIGKQYREIFNDLSDREICAFSVKDKSDCLNQNSNQTPKYEITAVTGIEVIRYKTFGFNPWASWENDQDPHCQKGYEDAKILIPEYSGYKRLNIHNGASHRAEKYICVKKEVINKDSNNIKEFIINPRVIKNLNEKLDTEKCFKKPGNTYIWDLLPFATQHLYLCWQTYNKLDNPEKKPVLDIGIHKRGDCTGLQDYEFEPERPNINHDQYYYRCQCQHMSFWGTLYEKRVLCYSDSFTDKSRR